MSYVWGLTSLRVKVPIDNKKQKLRLLNDYLNW